MKTQFTIIFAFLCCTACGEKVDDTGENTDFAPSEGTWNVGEFETITDTCGFNDDPSGEDTGEDEDTFQLTSTGEGTYDVQLDEEITLQCTVSGYDLSCATFENVEEDAENDMTLTQQMFLSGTFSSETAIDGIMKMDMNCEGEGCAFLEMMEITMPCSSEMSFNATK